MSRLIIGGAVVSLLVLGSVGHAPRLIWNASASLPIGLYGVRSGVPPAKGDLVLIKTPAFVVQLAALRGYLPRGVPLVKRIAALSGDHICAQGDAIVIDHVTAARRLAFDPNGRPLPDWTACRMLRDDEIFVLAPNPHSFDSRYFGPVRKSSVIGVLVPLWTH